MACYDTLIMQFLDLKLAINYYISYNMKNDVYNNITIYLEGYNAGF